ncbi:MAG: nuclear transport factor 2 family protein [Desulfopila sp.]
MNTFLNTFTETYKRIDKNNLSLLDDIYSADIAFVDPAHRVEGLDNLHAYFTGLYDTINSISFSFSHCIQTDDAGYIQWQMTFSHPRLNRGDTINLPGVSFIRFGPSNKVFFHQDFFDLGAMLYEHIPLLGGAIRRIKRRLAT